MGSYIRESALILITVTLVLGHAFVGGSIGCGTGAALGDETIDAADEFEGDGDGGDEVDSSSPSVFSVSPSSDATDVSLLTEISVEFDEPMDPVTIDVAAFLVNGQDGAIAGALSYDANDMRAIFTPESALERGAIYTVTVKGTVSDTAGNGMGVDFSWDFTTDGAYYVGANGNDGNMGIREEPWGSIQYAIDAVEAGSVIRIMAGSYREAASIGVNKSLSLVGDGADQTVIGPPLVIGSSYTDQAVFDVVGSDDNDPDNISVTIDGITVDAESTANLKFGIFLRGGSYAEIRNSTVRDVMPSVGDINSGGIAVGWNDFGFKSRALIEDNTITDFHSFGIAVYGTDNSAEIRDNLISGNPTMHICTTNPGGWAGAMGIVIQSNRDATVVGNTITNLRKNPACVAGSYDSAIETYWPGDMVIEDNLIEDNDYGFASYAGLGSAATLELNGNDILDNDVGVQLGAITVNSVSENNIEGNTTDGVRNTVAAAADVTDNYWGAADGPAPGGSGDAVSGNLITVPFSATPWE